MFKLIRNIYSFSQQIDYSQIAKQIQNATIENNQFALAVQKIQGDMKEVVQKAYLLPRVEKVLENIRSSHLCQAAVEQYVGSMYSPRNEQIAQLFLTYARQNAQSQQEVLEYKFYFYYLRKLEALQRGNQQEFDKVNSELIQLAGQGSLQAMHLIAKEMYKVAMNMMSGKQKKEKEKMLKEAYDLYYNSLQRFMTCAQKEFPHSFYYIGEMAERGDIQGGIDLVFALECYTIAASFDNPSAFFKLAQFHKDGVVCKKDPSLEFYYTKKAAEMGLLDAQHNLAVMYREGRIVPKDEIKALAWFTNAGNHGYPQSMYNAGMMFHEGGEKFKKNKKAALVWYEKVQQTGVINVQRLIDQLVQELDQ